MATLLAARLPPPRVPPPQPPFCNKQDHLPPPPSLAHRAFPKGLVLDALLGSGASGEVFSGRWEYLPVAAKKAG